MARYYTLLGALALCSSATFAAPFFPTTGTAAVIPGWVLVESSTASTVGHYAPVKAYNQTIGYLVNNIPNHFTVTGSTQAGPSWSNLYSSLANNTWTESSGAIIVLAVTNMYTNVYCALDNRTGYELHQDTENEDTTATRNLDMSAFDGVEFFYSAD